MDDEPLTEDATAGAGPPGSLRAATQRVAAVPAEPAEADLSGTLMNDYRLVRRIAVGGMGTVYEAIQLKLDRKVALKILSAELESRQEFLKRFEREAKSAATLNHPNVVQVYDFGRAGGRYYLIMELVEGEDLSDYVSNHGKLSLGEALSVAEQTARALKAALEKSIIHRDIKPSNLMRTTDGKIKVSDLGLAKKLTDKTDVTATGVGIGSPHFLAPEQADDARGVDHRADMYALGITLLFLLTGKRPFEGESAFSVVLAHANRPLPSGMDLGTELHPNVELLIRRMAAKAPGDRYADYDLLLADIERVKSGLPPSLPDGTLPEAAGSGRWLRFGMIAALVAVAIGLAAWLTFGGKGSAKMADETKARTRTDGAPTREKELDRPLEADRGMTFNHASPSELEARGRIPPTGPDGGRRPGPGAYLPPPSEEPDFTPLKDGPVDQMLAAADKYASEHPTDYMNIIRRYDQIFGKVSGTAREREIEDRGERWRRIHQDAARKEIESYRGKMEGLLSQGKRTEAQSLWRTFPPSLRNREVDTEIIQMLNTRFGTSFPTPP